MGIEGEVLKYVLSLVHLIMMPSMSSAMQDIAKSYETIEEQKESEDKFIGSFHLRYLFLNKPRFLRTQSTGSPDGTIQDLTLTLKMNFVK